MAKVLETCAADFALAWRYVLPEPTTSPCLYEVVVS